MGDLRDQLKKAKLLSQKDAKRIAHEERVHRKEAGREGLEREQEQRQRELAAQREQEREQDRARQQELEARRKVEAERAACLALLENEVVRPARGNSTWHFELPDGRLPVLKLSEADRHSLLGGHVCVVRRSTNPEALTFGLLATAHAARVRQHFPERIVWAAPPARAS